MTKKPKSIEQIAAEHEGWRLDKDGAFRNDSERLDDGSLASFWYDGNWAFLCAEGAIDLPDENES